MALTAHPELVEGPLLTTNVVLQAHYRRERDLHPCGVLVATGMDDCYEITSRLLLM